MNHEPADILRVETAWTRVVGNVDNASDWEEANRDFHLAQPIATNIEYLAAIGTAISAASTVSLHRTTNSDVQSNHDSLPTHERIVIALRKIDGCACKPRSI